MILESHLSFDQDLADNNDFLCKSDSYCTVLSIIVAKCDGQTSKTFFDKLKTWLDLFSYASLLLTLKIVRSYCTNLVFATQGVSNFYWKAILSAIMRSLHPQMPLVIRGGRSLLFTSLLLINHPFGLSYLKTMAGATEKLPRNKYA